MASRGLRDVRFTFRACGAAISVEDRKRFVSRMWMTFGKDFFSP